MTLLYKLGQAPVKDVPVKIVRRRANYAATFAGLAARL